jgi:hypothetical protein
MQRMGAVLGDKLSTRRAAAALRHWRQWSRWHRQCMLRVERHVLRTERAFTVRVLAGWVAVFKTRAEQMANLRMCITRKRVAQKWFLRWYWDAFDTDIKVALTDILETPETAEVLGTYWTSDDLRDAGAKRTPSRGQYAPRDSPVAVFPPESSTGGVLWRSDSRDSRLSNVNPVFDSGGSGLTRSSGSYTSRRVSPAALLDKTNVKWAAELAEGGKSGIELYRDSVAAYETGGSSLTSVLQSTERVEQRVSQVSYWDDGFTRYG